jgi:hypothetical protein
MVATFASVPELLLTEAESTQIAKASVQLADTYDFGIDPRAMAWSNMILVLGSVYGPRALGIYLRLKNEREQQAKKAG